MSEGRDSNGHFIKNNTPWNKKLAGSQREEIACVGRKQLIDGGVLQTDRIRVTCPACGEQVEVVTRKSRVKGYCAVARQYVDFKVKTRLVRQTLSPL